MTGKAKKSGRPRKEMAEIGKKTQFTGAEAAKYGSAGGIASGIARREKKTMRQILDILLEKQMTNENGEDVTTKEEILAAQVAKAIKGDLPATQFIRDTIGEKPADIQTITGALGVKKIFVTEKEQAEVEEHIADVIGDGR